MMRAFYRSGEREGGRTLAGSGHGGEGLLGPQREPTLFAPLTFQGIVQTGPGRKAGGY
jgi:hypothetical protein